MPTQPITSPDVFLYRLHKLASMASHPITRLCEGHYGITRREWRLILTLGRAGPLLSTQLANNARIEPARTSRGVTLLVEKGLALRQPRLNDRRYVDISLTDAGREIYDQMLPVVLDINNQLLSVLDEGERVMLDRLLTQLEYRAQSPLTSVELPKIDRQRSHKG